MPEFVTVICTTDGCIGNGEAIEMPLPTPEELTSVVWAGIQCGGCNALLYSSPEGEQ